MRLLAGFAALAAVLCAAAPARADDGLTSIRGGWIVAQRVYTSGSAADGVGSLLTELGFKVSFTDGKLSSRDACNSNYLVTSGNGSGTIDLTDPNTNTVHPGIFVLNGNILSIAVGAGTTRPSSFTGDDSQVLLVLKWDPNQG
jgi:hypothetical protein